MTDRSHAALMLENALALVSLETVYAIDQVKDELREGNSSVHSSFRSALARIVAREVGPLVKAVYVYGSPLENRARLNSDIDLLLVVSGKHLFARRRLEELDRSLTETYHELIGPLGASLSYLLDFHFITSTDIRQRKGYAAILSDPRALPPEKIYDAAEVSA